MCLYCKGTTKIGSLSNLCTPKRRCVQFFILYPPLCYKYMPYCRHPERPALCSPPRRHDGNGKNGEAHGRPQDRNRSRRAAHARAAQRMPRSAPPPLGRRPAHRPASTGSRGSFLPRRGNFLPRRGNILPRHQIFTARHAVENRCYVKKFTNDVIFFTNDVTFFT